MVINSNWDPYNTQGNEYFAKQGAIIYAQKSLKYRPVYTQVLFENALEMGFAGEQINAYSSGGHSHGHVNIHLARANVIFMADSFRNDWMTIPGPNGYEGHMRGIDSAMALADDKTLFVPGNTSQKTVSKIEDVYLEKQIRQAFYSRVEVLYSEGMEAANIAKDPELVALLKKHYSDKPFSPVSNVKHLIQTDMLPEVTITAAQLEAFTGTRVRA